MAFGADKTILAIISIREMIKDRFMNGKRCLGHIRRLAAQPIVSARWRIPRGYVHRVHVSRE